MGHLKIGSSLTVLTKLQFSSEAKELTFTVTTGTPADLMSTLVTRGSSEIVPNGFPPVLDTPGDHFKLAVDAAKRETSWGLQRVELDVNVRPAWKLGEHATITGITLKAKFTKAAGGWDKEVSIVGEVTIKGTPVKVTATLSGERVTLEVRGVTAVDAAALASPETAELVRTAPAIPSDTGVDDYKDSKTKAVLTFLKNGGGYRVDSVALQVGTTEGFQWVIIKPTLVLQKVYASVSVENIGRGAKLQLRVHGDLYVKKSARKDGVVSVDLTASKENMHLGLDMRDGSKQTKEKEQVATLGGCNITELLYMITAGGAALDINLGPRIIKIDLDLVWKNKTGTFTGKCLDWNLSDEYPDLAGMKEPSLTLSYVRRGRLSGSLDGYLGLLGGRVSMSYGIPKGPLLIAGINVKKAIELAKKLYKLFRRVKDVVTTIFKIVRTVGTVIAVAKMVGPAVRYLLVPTCFFHLFFSVFSFGIRFLLICVSRGISMYDWVSVTDTNVNHCPNSLLHSAPLRASSGQASPPSLAAAVAVAVAGAEVEATTRRKTSTTETRTTRKAQNGFLVGLAEPQASDPRQLSCTSTPSITRRQRDRGSSRSRSYRMLSWGMRKPSRPLPSSRLSRASRMAGPARIPAHLPWGITRSASARPGTHTTLTAPSPRQQACWGHSRRWRH